MDKSLGIIEVTFHKFLEDSLDDYGTITDISFLFTDEERAFLLQVAKGTKIPYFHIRLTFDGGTGATIELNGFASYGIYGYDFTTYEDLSDKVYHCAIDFSLGSVGIICSKLN